MTWGACKHVHMGKLQPRDHTVRHGYHFTVHAILSLREFAEKTLENLRKKLRQKVTKNATKSAE